MANSSINTMIHSNVNQVNLCHSYLNHLFGIQHPHLNDSSLAATQGNIFYHSVTALIKQMHIMPQDVFIDLGSGVGRIIFHVFLLSTAKKIIGIEMEHQLHIAAQEKYQRLMHELPFFADAERQIDILHGNFLENEFDDVSIVFVSAVCFSQATLRQLAKKLNRLPHLRSVFSLKPLTHFDALPFKRTVNLQCSWGASLCYWYSN